MPLRYGAEAVGGEAVAQPSPPLQLLQPPQAPPVLPDLLAPLLPDLLAPPVLPDLLAPLQQDSSTS